MKNFRKTYAAAGALELIPNNTNHNHTPVTFSVKFIEVSFLIEYGFTADLGNFFDVNYSRKILAETLKINEELIFTRSKGSEIGPLDCIKDFMVNAFEQNAKGVIAIAKSNLNDEELFLLNGFKTMFSSKLVSQITNWLDNKFMVIYRADAMHLIRKFSDPKKKSIYIEKTLNEAAAYFSINSNALGYVIEGESNEAKLCSLFLNTDKGTAIPADLFESYGTIRFVNMFPLVVNALLNGCTLVVDEFDASIHPMALMSIMNIFHNDDININHAQLIFITHNPIFLNANLFRRDEIKFEDYMNNYFIDRYGAIKDIDFTPIFESLLGRSEV